VAVFSKRYDAILNIVDRERTAFTRRDCCGAPRSIQRATVAFRTRSFSFSSTFGHVYSTFSPPRPHPPPVGAMP
jgi:hypothetical protein